MYIMYIKSENKFLFCSVFVLFLVITYIVISISDKCGTESSVAESSTEQPKGYIQAVPDISESGMQVGVITEFVEFPESDESEESADKYLDELQSAADKCLLETDAIVDNFKYSVSGFLLVCGAVIVGISIAGWCISNSMYIKEWLFTYKPYERLNRFCQRNQVALNEKVKHDIVRMCEDEVQLYENLIFDISRYRTFSKLKSNVTYSPDWMIWFFYVAQSNMVALSEADMKSVAINYLSDVLDVYNSYRESYGVSDAVDMLNNTYWLDLTPDDLSQIKSIVKHYAKDHDVKYKRRIEFTPNNVIFVKEKAR